VKYYFKVLWSNYPHAEFSTEVLVVYRVGEADKVILSFSVHRRNYTAMQFLSTY